MTFEEFQKSRRWSEDLARDVSSDNWSAQDTPKGWLYLGSLYIERVQPHWPKAAQERGSWHLQIYRDDWISDDLESLERKLYEWAVSEGYEKL